MEVRFEKAVQRIQDAPPKLSDQQKLKAYALYKQATSGKCNMPKPGMMDFVARAKWDSWSGLGDMPIETAQAGYADFVEGILGPADAAQPTAAKHEQAPAVQSFSPDKCVEPPAAADSSPGFGPVFSSMADIEEDADIVKDLCYYCSMNDLKTVKDMLAQGADVNMQDDAGQTGLHYAADRGFIHLAEVLLLNGACVDLKSTDGSTALHYACDNQCADTAKLLLRNGASPDIVNEDGAKPFELADPALAAELKRCELTGSPLPRNAGAADEFAGEISSAEAVDPVPTDDSFPSPACRAAPLQIAESSPVQPSASPVR